MTLENKNTNTVFKKGQWYSITLCPDDNHQYFGKLNRLKRFTNLINEYMVSWKQDGIDYVLWTELSEPKSKSKNGPRLHNHGIIWFNTNRSVRTFLLQNYYSLTRLGIIDIDTIDSLKVWIDYCTKQQHIINKSPISNLSEDVIRNVYLNNSVNIGPNYINSTK